MNPLRFYWTDSFRYETSRNIVAWPFWDSRQKMAARRKKMPRQSYSPAFKKEMVGLISCPDDIYTVAQHACIDVRLLRKWLHIAAERPDLEPLRPGPKPALPPEAEKHIHDWIIARQKSTRPVGRWDILKKARDISELVCDQSLGEGWYQRFMHRHLDLVMRKAQVLTKARGSVVDADISTLFYSLMKVMIEYGMDGTRIYNMDETAFQTKTNTNKVVALRGSKDVWNLDPATNFHLTIVACASASGAVTPPVFVLPGKLVKVDILVGCDLEGAAVTTTPSGFMNMALFSSWLRFFSASVPASVKRPILLIMDGCSSHYSVDLVDEAKALQIVIVLLPPNATHLLQPLDVAVFSTLKGKLKKLLSELMEEQGDGSYNINKSTAIKLVSLAWIQSHLGTNAAAGFKACGLYPLSILKMNDRLNRFKTNGTTVHPLQASWLQVREHIQASVLTLPPDQKATKKRKTTKVSGRILTRELLELAAAVPLAAAKSRSKKKTTRDVREASGNVFVPYTISI